MHAHRIEIFNRTNDNSIAGLIAHHFQFKLFPTQHALFNQHFMHRRKIDAALQNFNHLFAVVGDATARSTHGETGTQNDGITNALGKFQPRLNVVHQLRLRHIQANLAHRIFKQQPVFSFLNGANVGANQLHAALFQHARFSQFHRKIQRRLPAHR